MFPRRPSEGMPALGVTLVLAVLCLAGAIVDVALSRHLGVCFATAYVLGSGWVGARVLRNDLLAAVVAPPLVFGIVAFVAVQIVARDTGSQGLLVDEILAMGGALGSGAPVMYAGLALAGGLALVRLLAERAGRRSTAAATRPVPTRPTLDRPAVAPRAGTSPRTVSLDKAPVRQETPEVGREHADAEPDRAGVA